MLLAALPKQGGSLFSQGIENHGCKNKRPVNSILRVMVAEA